MVRRNRTFFLGVALAALMLRDARAASAVAVGTRGHYPVEVHGSRSIESAKAQALRECFEHGGVNPRIVLATDKVGYGAAAVAEKGKGSVFGFSLGKESKKEAASLAIEKCLKAGGRNPRIIAEFWG